MNVDWQSTETFDFPNETTKEWLMEQGSVEQQSGTPTAVGRKHSVQNLAQLVLIYLCHVLAAN